MRRAMKICVLLFSVLATAAAAAAEGEVLWWMVGPDFGSITAKNTEDNTVTTADALGVTDVRVRYESTDGSVGYLSFFGLNEDGSVTVYDGSTKLGGEYGMGLPAEYFGDLSGLSGESYSFVVELGNYSDGRWTHTSMESEKVSYDTLVAQKHITSWKNDAPSYGTPWVAGNYSVVPEPTSGLLTVLGIAFLALRRRRGSV
jgi:hypothetical protein